MFKENEKLKYKNLEGIDAKLSALVYGSPAPIADGGKSESQECYEAAFEAGFRVFDTANSYGNSEENMGAWLAATGKREDVVILDKGHNPGTLYMKPDEYGAATIREQMKLSLDRLQTEYVDMYILHRDDASKPVGEIVEVLTELHEKGMVRRFGGSNWTFARIMEANAYAKEHGLTGFSVFSPQFSYAKLSNDPWGVSVSLRSDDNEEYRKWLTDTQFPAFNYSSIARGFLSGKYHSDNRKPIEECIGQAPIMEYNTPDNVERLRRAEVIAAKYFYTVPQVALAWIMRQPMNMFPIVSPTGEGHLKEIVTASEIVLSDEDMEFLNV